jgi:surface antigen
MSNNTTNPFQWGQCTYEADSDWAAYLANTHNANQPYPKINGNADQWAAYAQSEGWTVTSNPELNSVAVFPGNLQTNNGQVSSNGHVGWVVATTGTQFEIDQMNWPEGDNKSNLMWFNDNSAIQFILA